MSEENVSLPVAQALASALEKIEEYVPTDYVDLSEPDIDAEHLNHSEQGIMRVTNLLNAAVDVIQGQQEQIEEAEKKISNAETKLGTGDLPAGMNDVISGLTTLNSNLEQTTNDSLLTYDVGSYSAMRIYGVSGFISTNSTECAIDFLLPINKKVKSIKITKLLCGLRHVSGGYIGGSNWANLTSYIVDSKIVQYGTIHIKLLNNDTWGITNNTPMAGWITLDFTLS